MPVYDTLLVLLAALAPASPEPISRPKLTAQSVRFRWFLLELEDERVAPDCEERPGRRVGTSVDSEEGVRVVSSCARTGPVQVAESGGVR